MFSIIMPVYNSERYVKEAIESVLNQNFNDFELIVIDDESQRVMHSHHLHHLKNL